MSESNKCIICDRAPEESEHFIETDDGFVCGDCLIDLKEIKRDHYDHVDGLTHFGEENEFIEN